MAYPFTDTGYNMYDMISMLQKGIRRYDFERAGFAAYQVRNSYRKVMWNRLLVISAEDCFGIITKEIVALKRNDDARPSDLNISRAVALLSASSKNRDACYFACNFVLASRKSREIEVKYQDVDALSRRIRMRTNPEHFNGSYDRGGFMQLSMFDEEESKPTVLENDEYKLYERGLFIQEALAHKDMDMIGYWMDSMRYTDREFLWDVFDDYAEMYSGFLSNEIHALREADCIVNDKKKDKDEIFISKAAILLCQSTDEDYQSLESCKIVNARGLIEWEGHKIKPISQCKLVDNQIPEWVYDCHTLKGKKMGKTDWDMTTTEQEALTPLRKCYFDDASWLYTYQQDLENGSITEEQMKPILEFAKTHEVNPVKPLPYENNN